jgi:Tol biopolymer transport system component
MPKTQTDMSSKRGSDMHRQLMLTAIALALLLAAGVGQASDDYAPAKQCADASCFQLESTIAFSSTRDNPTFQPVINAAEIYLVSPDGTNPRRLTFNSDGTANSAGDGFATLSPDGKKIVFDSNRNRAAGEPRNTSDLFLMNTDGTEQKLLTRGGSPTWSADSRHIAFHRSASGTGLPILPFPGAATADSDIFVANVDDLLAGSAQPRNITNNPETVDDDPDWSADGKRLVFTSHDVDEPDPSNAVSAEIYVLSADGTGALERLTFNAEEERGPAWSPDGMRIAYACRKGAIFEICVMDANGLSQMQLTIGGGLTPTWSPDGQHLVFNRLVAGLNQLFVINADGTGLTQITMPAGQNLIANWGELRVKNY